MAIRIDDDGMVEYNDMLFATLRAKVAGLHFAKESLTYHEREMLGVMEGLLAVVDAAAGGYFRGTAGELGITR